MCLDNLVVILPRQEKCVISISSHFAFSTETDSINQRIKLPIKLMTCTLKGEKDERVTLAYPRSKEWAFFRNATPNGILQFLNEETGSGCSNMKVFCVLLLERMV